MSAFTNEDKPIIQKGRAWETVGLPFLIRNSGKARVREIRLQNLANGFIP